jgi:hypothetical protein
MAAHANYPPDNDAEPVVRGDPETMIVRFRVKGVDQDISAWTFRCHVRKQLDGVLISECTNFEVVTPDELADVFEEGGTVPSVLLLHWSGDETKLWTSGVVADIEQLTPIKKTHVIFDSIRVDRDVSYSDNIP